MSNVELTKDIAVGLVVVGGAVVVVIASEASIPFLAGAGAIASLGAGLYQAFVVPRRKQVKP